MLNEILQIVSGDLEDDIDESNLNNKLKLICKNMSDLNIDYSVSRILELSVTEKRVLRELIKKYQEILM
jgi:ACT domain-containing protein